MGDSQKTDIFRNRDFSHQTRKTLIERLGTNIEADWRQFLNTYWRLIYSTANKKGLTPEDCEEVVQETLLAVFQKISSFRYEPKKGKFRSWLMTITHNKIHDRFRTIYREEAKKGLLLDWAEIHSAPVEHFDWDKDWKQNLFFSAMDNVREKIDPKHLQVFQMSTIDELGAAEVSTFLGLNRLQVYVINHRVCKTVTEEARRLEKLIY